MLHELVSGGRSRGSFARRCNVCQTQWIVALEKLQEAGKAATNLLEEEAA